MLATLLFVAAPALLQNARLETRVLEGPLEAAVAASGEAAWVGWGVPLHGSERACCVDWSRGRRPGPARCGLESSHGHNIGDDGRGGALPQRLLVFARVASGVTERLRVYTDDCGVDAEARRVVWLDGVRPAQSVAWLRALAAAGPRRLGDDALAALALHEAPESVPALVGIAKAGPSGETRGQALFWLAQRAGAEARAAITRAIEEDPETEVKRQAVFALSEMPRDEGIPLLIELARRHANPAVREQAFFWLGESEDPRAVAFFEEVLR